MALADLANDLRRQSKMQPNYSVLWIVYDIELIAVVDTDRFDGGNCEEVWFNTEGTEGLIESDNELYDALSILADYSNFIKVDNTEYERLTMLHVPKVESVFFTQAAAQHYIDENRHHLKKPYIKPISLDGNPEVHEVRQMIINTF